jgi:hypothetical protein
MTNTHTLAFAYILFGVLVIVLTKRFGMKDRDIWRLNLSGYLGGVAFIIIGILMMLNYFKR